MYKKKYSRKYRRRQRRYAKALQRGKISLNQVPSQMQNVVKMTHRWGHNQVTSLAAGLTSTKVYRVNGLYDPEYATGTGQISYRGFTNMSTLYNSYEVLAVRVDATIGLTSSNPSISTIKLYFDNNPTQPTGVQETLCQGWYNRVAVMNAFGAGSQLNYKKYVNIAKELAMTPGEQGLEASGNNDPFNILYFKIFFGNNSTETVGYLVNLHFTAYVLWKNKIE